MLRRFAFGAGVLIVAALTVAATYLGIVQMRVAGASSIEVDGPAQRSAVIDAAGNAVPRLFAYTPDTITGLPDAVSSLLTAEFRTEFANRVRDEIAPQAQQQRVSAQVQVVGAAVETVTADRASILVFINQTFTKPDQAPVFQRARLRVQLSKQGDSWLVQQVDPI